MQNSELVKVPRI